MEGKDNPLCLVLCETVTGYPTNGEKEVAV